MSLHAVITDRAGKVIRFTIHISYNNSSAGTYIIFTIRPSCSILHIVLSTWLAAVGILVYEQGFGFVQLYMAPFYMALPAVSAILIGGATVNKATIANVIIGTFLFQGIVTMTPTVMNSMIHMDMSEVIRVVVSQGMILYALTRKTEATK